MKFSVITAFLAITATSLFQSAQAQNAAEQATGFVGTYTNGSSKSRGVYAISLGDSGLSAPPRLVAELENASFVALHPSCPLLFAVSEIGASDTESVGLVAYSIGDGGKLTKLNQRSTLGGAACHVTVDPTGRCVGVANYTGGSCICFRF